MLVSIVMAVYNGEKYLNDAIKGALSQTYSNIEIIIVNDGSTDSTISILDRIKDDRVKVIHLNKNKGAAHALNKGIAVAKGSWIAVNDADDIYFPNKIEEQVKYLQRHSELVGVGTLVECVSDSHTISKKHLKEMARKNNYFYSRERIRKQLFYGSPIYHSSMMFPRDLFWKVGGYNTEYKITYDQDLWLKLLVKGDIEKVPKVLLYYHVHPKSLAHSDALKTCNEIQLTSAKAIYQQLRLQTKHQQPKVIVTGPAEACKFFMSTIAPICSLKVKNTIVDEWETKIPKVVEAVNRGKVDAIIVLEGYERKKIQQHLEAKGLEVNSNVFSLYNLR